MLTLLAEQPECLWEDALPLEVRELPEDLVALDVLLADPELLFPLVERWRQEFQETGRLVLTEGRPTIPLETYVRLMVLKQRYRWGYRTLVAEVSDSIHLRRFCRISLIERVPDESTDDSYYEFDQRLFGFAGRYAPVPSAVRAAFGGAGRAPPRPWPVVRVRRRRVGRRGVAGVGDRSRPGAG